MAVNLDSAQFRQFVQFAERQANPANSEADVHFGQTVEAPVLKDKVNVDYVRV